jgi:hypothetical protein
MRRPTIHYHFAKIPAAAMLHKYVGVPVFLVCRSQTCSAYGATRCTSAKQLLLLLVFEQSILVVSLRAIPFWFTKKSPPHSLLKVFTMLSLVAMVSLYDLRLPFASEVGMLLDDGSGSSRMAFLSRTAGSLPCFIVWRVKSFHDDLHVALGVVIGSVPHDVAR